MGRLELISLQGIPKIRPGADLAETILASLARMHLSLRAGDIVAIAQKIVSKSEGRYVVLDTVEPSPRALEIATTCRKDPRYVELVLRESRTVLRTVPGVLIVQDRRGLVLANAGVDRSNVEADEQGRERALLLPEDPDASAARLRGRLKELAEVDVGILINDSVGRAWRRGTVGVAIGAAGLPGLVDLRGTPDLFERKLEITEVGLADELAAAASAVMGQGAEGTPVVLIRGVDWPRREGTATELQRPQEQDLFR